MGAGWLQRLSHTPENLTGLCLQRDSTEVLGQGRPVGSEVIRDLGDQILSLVAGR